MSYLEIAATALDEWEQCNTYDSYSTNGVDMEKHDAKFHNGHFDPETQSCSLREGQAKNDDADVVPSNGVTPEEDAAYADAVKRGDRETALRMIREASAKADPSVRVKGLHRYYVLNRPLGIGNTPKMQIVGRYDFTSAKYIQGAGGNVYGVIVTENPLSDDEQKTNELVSVDDVVEVQRVSGLDDESRYQEEDWRDLPSVSRYGSIRERNEHRESLNEERNKRNLAIAEWIKYSNDFLLFKNDVDGSFAIVSPDKWYADSNGWRISFVNNSVVGNHSQITPMYHDNNFKSKLSAVVALDKQGDGHYEFVAGEIVPDRIKSADITYDDDGNLIPLSKRFNFASSDVRDEAIESYTEDFDIGATMSKAKRGVAGVFKDMASGAGKDKIGNGGGRRCYAGLAVARQPISQRTLRSESGEVPVPRGDEQDAEFNGNAEWTEPGDGSAT